MPRAEVTDNVGQTKAKSVELRPTVLVLMDYYLPGVKSGGPLHAIRGLTDALGSEFKFRIITSDRDLLDKKPYPGIQRGRWMRIGNADVLYVNRRNPISVIRYILRTPHQVLYMKSFFSRPFSMWPIWMRALGILRSKSLVVAPSGEFAPGALELKKRRKEIYIAIARIMPVYRRVIWHATSEFEATDVRREIGDEIRTVTARNLGPPTDVEPYSSRGLHVFVASELAPTADASAELAILGAKMPGELRAVFLSRIARNKNLDGALKMLHGLKGRVLFHIYGPIEDKDYWQECQQIVRKLPAAIRVRYNGIVPHPEVTRVLSGYHLFLFPTKGENFSYAILEALLAGCPILISDRTPWRKLEEAGVGWSLPLEEPERFRNVLQSCIDMSRDEFERMSERARAYGVERSQDPDVVSRNRVLLQTALGRA